MTKSVDSRCEKVYNIITKIVKGTQRPIKRRTQHE